MRERFDGARASMQWCDPAPQRIFRNFLAVLSCKVHQRFIQRLHAADMKTHLLLSFAVVLAASGFMLLAEPSEPPPSAELSRAYVTIPYAELRALWEAGQAGKARPEKPPDAPLGSVVQQMELDLRLGDRASALTARFAVEVLNPRWQAIPLLGGEVRLEKVEPAGRQIVWQDGYSLLTDQPGQAAVVLQAGMRGTKSLTPENPLRLKLDRATVKRLRVSGIPAGLEARVDGQPAAEVTDGVALFALGSEAADITLSLVEPRVEKPPKPIEPSRWQTQSQTLVRYAEGRLQFRSRIFAHSDAGSGLEIMLALPSNAAAVSAAGEDVADWAALRMDDGRRVLGVRWKTADVLDRELTVTYAVPQSPLAEQWNLQAPSAPEDAAAKHLFAILPAEGLELKGEGVRAAVVSHRLPSWMREEIGGAAFVTTESGAQLALQTNWLPVIAAAEAIITEAKCQLRLVADGSQQTTVAYTIKHRAPLAWTLELPPEVEILSCIVAGQEARPIQRDKGTIEFSLPAPRDAAKGQTQVALVYAAKAKALDPVSGQIALELPRTPLFIERLDWFIAIPAALEVTAAEGNVAIAAPAEASAETNTITLRKDLCRAERPGVELFYQRRSLEK
jgi:hypothetical protein